MLNSEDMAVLDFEAAWWKQVGAKDQAIEYSLGLTAAHYYERLLQLVDTPSAMTYDPLTVRRIGRMIEPKSGREVAV
jgi:hypothetical protein